MKLLIVAVGQRIPAWAESACADYLKRFGSDQPIWVQAVKAEPRAGQAISQVLQAERQRILILIDKFLGRDRRVVALDERGERLNTQALASQLAHHRAEGQDLALVIGGADGLDPAFKTQVQALWRLSDLTLPHALARVLLIEQLYRAHSLLAGHPYHRE